MDNREQTIDVAHEAKVVHAAIASAYAASWDDSEMVRNALDRATQRLDRMIEFLETPPIITDEIVTIPRESLRMLYECAASYDRRIPEGNGRDWVWPIETALGIEP